MVDERTEEDSNQVHGEVDRSSSEDRESCSEGENTGQVGNCARNGEKGDNGDNQDVLLMEEEMQGRAVYIEKCDRNLFYTYVAAVGWESMCIIPNHICHTDEFHRNCAVTTVSQYR